MACYFINFCNDNLIYLLHFFPALLYFSSKAFCFYLWSKFIQLPILLYSAKPDLVLFKVFLVLAFVHVYPVILHFSGFCTLCDLVKSLSYSLKAGVPWKNAWLGSYGTKLNMIMYDVLLSCGHIILYLFYSEDHELVRSHDLVILGIMIELM